jgi:hypothetical protein
MRRLGRALSDRSVTHIEMGPLMRHRLDATIAELADECRGVFSRETARYVEESAYDAEAVAREVVAAGLPGEYAEELVAAA